MAFRQMGVVGHSRGDALPLSVARLRERQGGGLLHDSGIPYSGTPAPAPLPVALLWQSYGEGRGEGHDLLRPAMGGDAKTAFGQMSCTVVIHLRIMGYVQSPLRLPHRFRLHWNE